MKNKIKTITACVALGVIMLWSNFANAQNVCATTLLEDYSPMGTWTLVNPATACTGTAVGISGSTFNFNGSNDGTENRMWRSITALSNIAWTSEFKFHVSSTSNAPAHILAAFTAGTADPYNTVTVACNGGTFGTTNQDAIAAMIYSNSNNTSWQIIGQSKDNANAWTQSIPINITTATTADYYIRLQRLSTTQGLISIFTTAAMTTHITGSPQCFTIASTCTGLADLQHGTIPQGGTQRTLHGYIDNMYAMDVTAPTISGPSAICCPPGSVTHPTWSASVCGATYYCWTFPTGVTVDNWNAADHSSVTVTLNCGTFVSPSNINVAPVFGGTTCPPGTASACTYSINLSVSTNCNCCRIGNSDNPELQESLSDYSIYPNPSDGKIMIEAVEEIQSVVITDITGRVVYTKNNFSAATISVDLSKEPKGIYLVKIMQNGINRIEKITIE